ncbi:MAG TPA: sigma-70 family RNA polymerase sigma factor [Polyangiales bacterium]|jgi:RNA polymerase sigma-70 factor (ECF subfamily)|nr:sigma-70 family RNA polymerase sigma factor [Polyangiales bacterium]
MSSDNVIPLDSVRAVLDRDAESVPPARPLDPTLQAQIAAAISGDASAAHALVLRVLPRVRNMIRYLIRGDDVDDFTQDVLVTVLERLHSFRGESRFEAWVDGVTLRVTLRKLSKLRADVRRFERSASEVLEAHYEPAVSPRYLARRRAVAALDQLPDAQRHALVMHHVLGMTVAEIASELDTPAETIRSRLRVAMGKLRVLLGATDEVSP